MSELILVVSDSTLTPMSDIGASVAECKKEDSEETLEVGGRGKIIANFGLRNREPARRVGVRRTIVNCEFEGLTILD